MNIVMVPFHDYKKWLNEGFRTRDAHLCQHFAESGDIKKILVVNRPVSLAELILKRKGWKTFQCKVIYNENGICLSQVSDKIWCLDFFLSDFFKVLWQRKMWWFTSFQHATVLKAINDAINFLEMENSILLLQNPMAVGVVEHLYCKSFVFDAIDNWMFHPQMKNKNLIRKNYEYVDRHADLIMTVSNALTKTFVNNKNVFWIPNGVDIDYFKPAVKIKDEESIPVIGYVGKIQDRVDFALVEKCIRILPNCCFEFVGPIYSQKKLVRKLMSRYKNLKFTGDIHYVDLPQEMSKFDITIIPHKIDGFTDSMNPLKLYEYLAAGKVVVTTSVAGTEQISPYVYSANNDDDFIGNLRSAVSDLSRNELDSEKIIASIPEECRWSSRVNAIIRLFETLCFDV